MDQTSEQPVAPSAWPVPPPDQHPASASEKIFFGPFGMRAGWTISIFAALWFILQIFGGIAALVASHQLKPALDARANPAAHSAFHLAFTPAFVDGADGVAFFGLLIICWVYSKAERRPLSSYGLASNRVADVIPGAITGIIAMAILVCVLRSLHVLVFDSRALYGATAVFFGFKWLIAFALVGFCEEYSFRGYTQFTLMRGLWGLAGRISPASQRAWAFWIAATIWSLGFGCIHLSNKGETHFGIVAVFLAGMTFCYSLWRTGSLWWAIGLHATWDWAQSFLFGVADSGNISVGRLFVTHPAGRPLLSGGSDGPEGSILVIPVLLAIIVVIRFTTRPGPQPAIEQMPPEPVTQ